jgi:hypothetical protein
VKPQEVIKHYKTKYNFHKETGIAANTLGNWLRIGRIPEGQQYKIERLTNGLLKADMNHGHSK